MLLRKSFGVLSGLVQTGRGLNDQEKQDRSKFLAHVFAVTVVSKARKVLEAHFGTPSVRLLSLVFGEGFLSVFLVFSTTKNTSIYAHLLSLEVFSDSQ